MKLTMRKMVILLALLMWIGGAAQADTLYLRNGNVLNGTFTGFENGVFAFEDSEGNPQTFTANRVLRLVIERDRGRRSSRQRDSGSASSRGTETVAPFDVRLENQWTRSQLQINRGDRVRVEAGGTVTLEGRTSVNPDGLGNRRDRDAPMPNENDGALIASIGQDYDSPAILIGSSRTFVADRDGMLYFSINHGNTSNARGAFRVNLSVDRQSGSSTIQSRLRERTVSIPANQPWTDTGIDIAPNMTVEITAEGEIKFSSGGSAGPEGDRGAISNRSNYPIPSEGVGALIAKLRRTNGQDSSIRYIGSSNRLSTGSNDAGRLFIGVNDDIFRDNTGSYQVTIRW